MLKRSLACVALLTGLWLGVSGSAFVVSPPAADDTPVLPADSALLIYQPALKPEFADDVFRLPGATRYDIEVRILPGDAPRVVGLARVHYTNTETEPLQQVVFRLYPNLPEYGGSMTVNEVTLNGVPVQPTYSAGRSALAVSLLPALAPGESVTLTLDYEADVPTDTRSGYAVFTHADGVYALAGFYPTIPVFDAEGWNVEVAPPYGDVTYTDAAFYRVQLTAPGNLVAVTSGQIIATADNENDTRTWTAVAGPMRDFYIALSADYQVFSEEVNGTQVNSYYRAGHEETGQRALRYTVQALRLFDDKFGAYPYTELDVVPTPTTAGGIEYPGVIVISQSLYGEQGHYFELVVAHEAVHQWWYGLVGTDQLDAPWLDESLANYSMYVYYQATGPAEEADRIKQFAFVDAYNDLQRNHLDRAVGGPVAGFNSLSDYVAVVYGKGPLFFDAVRARLGDGAFFAALRNYATQHRYGIAYAHDLIAAFEETSGQSIEDLYRAWILGVPP
jgi:aminopeptidase N